MVSARKEHAHSWSVASNFCVWISHFLFPCFGRVNLNGIFGVILVVERLLLDYKFAFLKLLLFKNFHWWSHVDQKISFYLQKLDFEVNFDWKIAFMNHFCLKNPIFGSLSVEKFHFGSFSVEKLHFKSRSDRKFHIWSYFKQKIPLLNSQWPKNSTFEVKLIEKFHFWSQFRLKIPPLKSL